MQCSVRSSSLATVPYSMKNIITCFQFSPDVQQSITNLVFCLGNMNLLNYCVTAQCRKNVNFSALNFIVLNSLYHALILAQSSYEEKTRCYRTGPVPTLS